MIVIARRAVVMANYVLKNNKFTSAWILFLMILVGAFEAVGVISLIPVIEELSGKQGASKYTYYVNEVLRSLSINVDIYTYLCFFGVIVCFKSFFRYLSKFFLLKNQVRIESSLSLELFDAVISSSGTFFMSAKQGELLNGLVGEVRKVGDCIYYLYDFIAVFIRFIFYSLVLFTFSFKLSFCIFAVSGIVSSIPLFISKHIHEKSSLRVFYTSEIQDFLIQVISNFSQIKSYVAGYFFSNHYKTRIDNYTQIHARVRLLSDLSSIIFEPLGVFQIIFIIFLSLEYFNLPFSEILIILVALRSSIPLLGQMATYFNVVVSSSTSFESVMELLSRSRLNEERVTGEPIASFNSDILVENLSLKLGANLILKEVSLRINKGDFVAIVGNSGGGKSTLINVISGFIAPSNGSIKVDGKPLKEISLTDWRKLASLVPQLPIIMKGTIDQNIAFGEVVQDQKKIKKALADSNLSDFVSSLKDKGGSFIGEGRSMSGGQSQRLSIARALYRDPQILLLDEPTSALDGDTERSIIKTLHEIRGKKTIIMVTHDLNLVKDCDCIYVLKDGKIAEFGKYNELLQGKGHFSEMLV